MPRRPRVARGVWRVCSCDDTKRSTEGFGPGRPKRGSFENSPEDGRAKLGDSGAAKSVPLALWFGGGADPKGRARRSGRARPDHPSTPELDSIATHVHPQHPQTSQPHVHNLRVITNRSRRRLL